MSKVFTVFTFRALARILAEGGSSAWTCKPETAATCAYLIVTRNSRGVPGHNGHPGYPAEGDEPHGSAFMIGRISGVERCDDQQPGTTPRYNIKIDRWAPLNIPNVWGGWRLPFKYMTLEECGITDVDALDWQDMPTTEVTKPEAGATVPLVLPAFRTIEQIAAELKQAIAAQRHISADAVSINVSVKVEEAFAI